MDVVDRVALATHLSFFIALFQPDSSPLRCIRTMHVVSRYPVIFLKEKKKMYYLLAGVANKVVVHLDASLRQDEVFNDVNDFNRWLSSRQ